MPGLLKLGSFSLTNISKEQINHLINIVAIIINQTIDCQIKVALKGFLLFLGGEFK
jgi:hypothetical protein